MNVQEAKRTALKTDGLLETARRDTSFGVALGCGGGIFTP
jgi:hypothetical protein